MPAGQLAFSPQDLHCSQDARMRNAQATPQPAAAWTLQALQHCKAAQA